MTPHSKEQQKCYKIMQIMIIWPTVFAKKNAIYKIAFFFCDTLYVRKPTHISIACYVRKTPESLYISINH